MQLQTHRLVGPHACLPTPWGLDDHLGMSPRTCSYESFPGISSQIVFAGLQSALTHISYLITSALGKLRALESAGATGVLCFNPLERNCSQLFLANRVE